jgi:hypothetical protein
VIAKFRPAHRARIIAAFLSALAHCEGQVSADYVVLQARDTNDFALRSDPPEYWQRHLDTWSAGHYRPANSIPIAGSGSARTRLPWSAICPRSGRRPGTNVRKSHDKGDLGALTGDGDRSGSAYAHWAAVRSAAPSCRAGQEGQRR